MSAPDFQTVTLCDRWPEARDLVGLAVDLRGTTLARTFANPGQYVQLRLQDGQLGYFAIASCPNGEERFEFLVKTGAPITDALAALPIGARLELTPAMGQGYPIQHHRGKDVLLFAVGSGISPIRSLIWYLAAHRAEYAGVTLFFGARTPAHFAYQDEIPAWEQEGVRVVRVVSGADGPEDGYVRGYVQNALAEHPIAPEGSVAFVCGMKSMVEGVTAELERRGLDPALVFQNY